MEWRLHVLVGIAVSALACIFLLQASPYAIEFAFLAAFGGLSALVPDLDHDSSKGRKWLDIAFVAFALMAVYASGCGPHVCLPGINELLAMALSFFVLAGAYFVFFRFFKPRHRGITHTLAACFVFGLLVFLVAGREFALAGVSGYASHLLADGHIRTI